MQERFTLYCPNGKHGVNTLNCKARYDNDGKPIYPDGWQVLSEEQVQGLANKSLAWEDDKLVPYYKTGDELLAEINESKREKARQEIREIETWFTNIYDAQIKQAQRCERLGVAYDNKYGTVAELDQIANEKATRIRELRAILQI